ncbi:MAG: 3-keto-5-aminohexanoate cleavage protein [Pseudomonadota bacterium]
MLQACLNGGRAETFVPASAKQLAEAAHDAFVAGAEEFHIHPRNLERVETLHARAVAEAVSALREKVGYAPIGLGSGAWIAPGGRKRHSDIASWQTCPNYVSVNFGEEDALDVIKILNGHRVGFEAGLWTERDTLRFIAEGPYDNLERVLIEMPDVAPDEAIDLSKACLTILKKAGCDAPILLHGEGESTWPCLQEAAKLGLQTRIGFEDTLLLPDGLPAPDNTALVDAAFELGRLS